LRKLYLFFALGIFILLACASENIFRPTPVPPATNTPNPTQLIVPPDIGNSGNPQKLVKYLLQTNGGCKLPCWWGITPGQTSWRQARPILEETSISIDGQESQGEFYAKVRVYLPYPYDFAPSMEHVYRVKNGIVDYIRVYNFDLAPEYILPRVLQTYGPPTEVWIRTFAKADLGAQDYLVELFYKEAGILLEYRTGHPLEELKGKLRNCRINEMDAPVIHLWSTQGQDLTFEDAKQFIDTANLPQPRSLLDATGMDVQTFYETFMDRTTNACLETPKNLWP
jgi:hypothetical protein